MSEIVKVKILSGGATAIEVNPLGEKPKWKYYFGEKPRRLEDQKIEKWEKAESKLRTFEIDFSMVDNSKKKLLRDGYFVDSIHSAEVLESGKVRIV